ncbi:phosphatase PAP2 family protein [Paenibacillus sp. FSL H8-0537]|uniref:phosphatase PAP2 family protein n=1 Tax=Paenibacillus sp. FSL H8-0537 TaxID=2921399 RepID=UPI0031016941
MLIFALTAQQAVRLELSQLDKETAAFAQQMRGEGWTAFFRVLSYMGSSLFIIAATFALFLWFGWRSGWLKAAPIIVGTGLVYITNTLAKMAFDRGRPEEAWGIEAASTSFPSGNAMMALSLYGLAAIWIGRDAWFSQTTKRISYVLAGLLILLMGASRLYFSVHYATDIIGGYAASFAILALMMAVLTARR